MKRRRSGIFHNLLRFILLLILAQILQPPIFGYRNAAETRHHPHFILGISAAHAQGNPADLLGSTPDADISDPFIIEKANELGNDPGAIFEFVRDEIGYESYAGSLRGARGTLWSQAGNALDQASLLIALLRVSGVPARYAGGTLTDDQAKELILSMFPEPLRVLSCLDPDVETADPANDPQLLDEARDHFWVEADLGGFQAMDPTFSGAAIGDAMADVEATFAEVPDGLRHKVTVRLNRELTSPGASLLTGGAASADVATVLDQTFNSVELVGRSLSVGHFVTSGELGAIFSVVTNTYSPYVIINQRDGDVNDDPLFPGTAYQEVLTNFPFGSQVLTGLFLEVVLHFPDGKTETLTKTLLDRIGFVARKTGSIIDIDLGPDTQAAITTQDIVTLDVSAIRKYPEPAAQLERLSEIEMELDKLTPMLTSEQTEIAAPAIQRATQLSLQAILEATSIISARFQQQASAFNELMASYVFVRGYYASPPVIVVSNISDSDPQTDELTGALELDLLETKARIYAPPYQGKNIEGVVRLTRGLANSIIETQILADLDETESSTTHGAMDVFLRALKSPEAFIELVDEDGLSVLSSSDLSPEAQRRIADAAIGGSMVLVPSRTLVQNDDASIAWLEFDVDTGDIIAVSENGAHQGLLERINIGALQALKEGATRAGVQYARRVGLRVTELAKQGKVKEAKKVLTDALAVIMKIDPLTYGVLSPYVGAFKIFALTSRVQQGANLASYAGLVDPPVGQMLFDGLASSDFSSFVAGQSAPFAVGIGLDPLFTVGSNGAQVPTVFRVGFKNPTTAADTFSIDVSNVPAGFSADQSVTTLRVPPGETGEISVCLRPTGGVPASNAPASFNVSVTSTTDPAISVTRTMSFTVPDIHGITLTAEPTAPATTPGTPIAVTLTITSAGNVPENVTFDLETPAELSVADLTPVSLPMGETQTIELTLTPDANTPLNTTLVATVTANFGAPEPKILGIPVRVAAPGADSTAEAAVAAADLGNDDLANRFNDLSIALTNLSQDPASVLAKSQVLANLDSILSLLGNDAGVSAFVPDLQAARDGLASAATGAEIQTAITALGAALDDFSNAATDAARHDVQIHLTPNQQTSQPLVPTTFQILLHNVGSDTTTYDLAVLGVQAGVTAQFSQNQIILDRDQFSSGLTLTLTPNGADEVPVFDFQVTATASGTSFSRSAAGALSARSAFVSVTEVTVDPPFLDAGGSVDVTARILNAVNRQQDVLVSYEVKDPGGAQVFASTPVQAALTTQTSLLDVDLGALDTTGFAQGNHTVEVMITNLAGTPIPDGTGQGTLLIGSPVTASLSVAPEVLPPGDGMVLNTLQVNSGTPSNTDPITLIGQLAVDAFGNDTLNGIELNGDIAYVFGNGGVHVVDITDPTAPAFVRTVDSSFAESFGQVVDGQLITGHSGFETNIAVFSNSTLRLFDLANVVGGTPDNPLGRGVLFPNYQFMAGFVVSGDHVFAAYNYLRLNLATSDISVQTGTVLSFDISNPAGPVQTDALLNSNGGMAEGPLFLSGGNFNMFDVELPAPDTLLVASTTATGTDTQTGVGRILVVDISDPDNINSDPPNPSKIVKELQIPGTVQIHGLALDGDLLFAVGSQGGWLDPFVTRDDLGPTGNLVLAAVDISDPRNPQLIHTQVIDRAARSGGADVIALGSNRFAFSSLGSLTDDPQLFVVDATNPNDPAILSRFDVPGQIRTMHTDGSFLYTSGVDGLTIYELAGAGAIPVTARVRVPTNTGVAVDPDSFSTPPDQTIADQGFDTLVWNLPQGATITWKSTVADLQPGEARTVTAGAAAAFSFLGQPGEVSLPPTRVVSEQILGITPTSQTIQPGAEASYTLTVQNPAGSPVTYDLAVQGVPSAWVDPLASVDVPAGGQTDVPLVLGPDAFAVLGDYGFSVTAGAGGTTGSVQAALTLEGEAVLPVVSPDARGIVAELTPQRLAAGQGTPAVFRLRLSNAGSVLDTFKPAVSLPPGFAGEFSPNAVDVPPGAGNFREILLTITPPVGTPAGDVGFEVTAVSSTDSAVKDQVSGIVAVSGLGVDVILQASSANILQMKVTNTGRNTDTFDLTLAGPLAPFASLATTAATLQPGQSQTVPISLQAIDFAIPGVLVLTGIATSRSDGQVQNHDDASINVVARQGVSAEFDPQVVTLQEPGKAAFLLLVQNTGNVEDSYTAAITSTSANVSANLIGLDGQPTQSIPLFILPGLASGVIQLDANLDDATDGSATVAISSLNHSDIGSAPSAFISVIADKIRQIPTLSGWAKLLLVLLLVLLSGWMLKRRSRPRTGSG